MSARKFVSKRLIRLTKFVNVGCWSKIVFSVGNLCCFISAIVTRCVVSFFLELDVHERFYSCSADWTRVVLHTNDLTAPLTQAKMSTRQNHCIFHNGIANDTFSLRFSTHLIPRCLASATATILFAIHVGQLKNGLVVLYTKIIMINIETIIATAAS